MILSNLISKLENHLKEATKVWVAVALIKDNGFTKIQECIINKNAIQHWLVGIDLPTTPSVLRELKSKISPNFTALIYNKPETFHPKVYLIKKVDVYVAFVGSANATEGGFERNIELSYCITNQDDCKSIEEWFNAVNDLGEEITDEFIVSYESIYKKNQFLSSIKKSNNDNLKGLNKSIAGGAITVGQEQFFRQSDFDAYSPIYHFDGSTNAVDLRRNVRNRLRELNSLVFPKLKEYGISELYCHSNYNNYTSYHWHSRGNTHIPQDAIWFHYGKSEVELAANYKTGFTDNIRIQVILRNVTKEAYVGIWLFIGKPNGSYYDRKYLKDKLEDKNFLLTLYEYIMDLGGAYWLNVCDDELWVSDIKTAQDVYDFLSEDDFESYFIIGRNYQPNDIDLNNEKIQQTVLIEFSKLYKIYDLIKAK